MVAKSLIAVFGLACIVAVASAQTSPVSSLWTNTEQDGNYLVNGTGVVYDKDSVTLWVNGEPIQKLKRALAPGPSPDDHKDHDDKDKDDKDKHPDLFHDKDDKEKDDKDKDDKDKDDKDKDDKDHKKKPDTPPGSPPILSPTASPEDEEAAEGGLGNPLDKIIVGRKML